MAPQPQTTHRLRPIHMALVGGLTALLVLMGVGRSLASEPARSPQDALPAADTQTTASETSGGENAGKREVVYAHLGLNGAVEGVYVVNMFDKTPEGPVSDYGSYGELRNLTNTAELSAEGDEITFEGTGGPFSYEGTLANPQLPWNLAMEYTLDGKSVDATELGGATGTVTITIDTTPNTAVDSSYYDNYMVQISFTLPADRVDHIAATSGQVAMAASDYNVTFMAMPESPGHFELTADVSDFEMGAVNIAAVPLSFAIDAPDTDELINGFEQLGDGVDTLADGASALAEGSSSLADGLDAFGSGAAELAEGTTQTADGASQLSQGSASLADGGSSLASGANEVAANIRELAAGLAQFRSELAAQAETSAAQAEAIGPALPDTSAIESAVAEYAAAYSTAYSELYTPAFLASYTASIEAGTDPSIAAADAASTAASSAAYQAANSSAVLGALSAIGDAAGAVASDAAAVAGQAGGLQGTAETLQSVADNLSTLALGAEQLAGGADSLASGAEQLAGGASELAGGAQSWADGVGSLAAGADELAAGASSATSGAHELSDGADQLASGTQELSSEVSTMPDEMQSRIDDMLSSYDRSNYEPQSFASPKNKAVVLVQFVCSTDPITAPDDAAAEEPEAENPSLIDRLLSLFN